MSKLIIPRKPWPEGFPNVIIHNSLKNRDNHPAFLFAKSGDQDAAAELAEDLINIDSIKEMKEILGEQQAFLAPVTALEAEGINAIPDALTVRLSISLNLPIEPGAIIQINKVGHTRAKGWHRTVTPAMFSGEVKAGAAYILVDDHVGHGGTLANMRGYIEENGGKVILMTTLTETREARTIALQKHTLDMLRSKHGNELEQFWIDVFGYEFTCLTNIEAGYLSRQLSFDAIRAAIVTAIQEAGSRGLSTIQSP